MARALALLLAAGCAAPAPGGPRPVFDPDGGFFDTPFPSDERRDDDGTIRLAGWPNPYAVPLLVNYLERAERLTGFGTNAPLWIRFEAPLDPAVLPLPEDSVRDGSPLVLVDVDPDSPWFGERIPVQWELRPDPGVYVPGNLLAVAPVFGFPLRPDTTYALVVTTAIAARHEGWAARLDPDAREFDENLRHALFFLGLHSDEVAIATTFTTQDPLDEMRRLATHVQERLGIPPLDAEPLERLSDRSTYTAWRTRYASPVFTHGEPPYLVSGGEFRWDAQGEPLVARWDEMRLSVCTPAGLPEPEAGWPVVIYQHGTGGAYRGFCDSEGAFEVARRLGEVGIVGVGIDQPLHGTRPGAETASDLAHFNIVNPDGAVTNFRQGAIDAVYLAHALADRPWTFRGDSGETFRTDPERVMFVGHSQGGLTGAIAGPFVGRDLDAMVLSGAGGVLAITIVERKDPLDFALLVRNLLELPEEEELTPLHPTLGLVQSLVEVTDPVNYAPYWFSEPGAWPSHAPLPVLATSGTLDAATPYRTALAMAAAARLPLVGDPATRIEPLRMRGRDPAPLPTVDNTTTFDGGRATTGFAQFLDGSHFVIFEEAEASDLYVNWLSSTAEGRPALWVDDPEEPRSDRASR